MFLLSPYTFLSFPLFNVADQHLPCTDQIRPSCFDCSAAAPGQNTFWPAPGSPAPLACTSPAFGGRQTRPVNFTEGHQERSNLFQNQGIIKTENTYTKTKHAKQKQQASFKTHPGISSSASGSMTITLCHFEQAPSESSVTGKVNIYPLHKS